MKERKRERSTGGRSDKPIKRWRANHIRVYRYTSLWLSSLLSLSHKYTCARACTLTLTCKYLPTYIYTNTHTLSLACSGRFFNSCSLLKHTQATRCVMWRDGKQRVMPVRRPVARAAAVVDQENQQSEMGDYPTAQTTTTTHFLVPVLAKPPLALLHRGSHSFLPSIWCWTMDERTNEDMIRLYVMTSVCMCVCVVWGCVCWRLYMLMEMCTGYTFESKRQSVCVWSMCVCVHLCLSICV